MFWTVILTARIFSLASFLESNPQLFHISLGNSDL